MTDRPRTAIDRIDGLIIDDQWTPPPTEAQRAVALAWIERLAKEGVVFHPHTIELTSEQYDALTKAGKL